MGDISDVIDIDSIADELEYLYGTKQAIADAINEVGESQGISVTSADTFRSYADKIRKFGQCEVGKISVRTTPLYDEEIGTYQTFEAPEGKVWKEVKVHIDAWSAVTQEVDPLIISENGFYDINEMSASKFAFSEVQNPTGNPKQKGYFEKIKSKYYPTEDTEVVEGKTYYVEDKTKEYETASSFIINVQRSGAAPFTCDFCDEAGNIIEHHEGIPYGGWCQFEGETPTSGSDLKFQGWNPPPNNIQTNMKCYPKFFSPQISADEIGMSWAEIVTMHGKDIPIGAFKTLPLKDTAFTLKGHTLTIDTSPIMQKVYNGEDVSTSSWLAMNFVVVDMVGEILSNWWINGSTTTGSISTSYIGDAMFGSDFRVNPNKENANKYFTTDELLNAILENCIPDYIRQFIVPVTKYSTTIDCPNKSSISYMTASQKNLWIPSMRELNVPPTGTDGAGIPYSKIITQKGPVYSDIYTEDNNTRKKTGNAGYQRYSVRETIAHGDWLGSYMITGDGDKSQGVIGNLAIGFCL